MKASPAARSWIAAGVRHELLMRALPSLRHDMVAPISVMRMGLLMLKRQVGAQAIDAAACEERVALVESQVAGLVEGIRSLRDWELAPAGEGITRSALVAQCVGLMRAAFDLQGVSLEIAGDALDPRDDEPRWPAAASLRYLFLGALGYLHDGALQPGAIRVEAEGADALRLSASPRAGDGVRPLIDTQGAPRALAIDAVAFQSLAEDLGHGVALERASVRLSLASG